jgi:hypothetical protein
MGEAASSHPRRKLAGFIPLISPPREGTLPLMMNPTLGVMKSDRFP